MRKYNDSVIYNTEDIVFD